MKPSKLWRVIPKEPFIALYFRQQVGYYEAREHARWRFQNPAAEVEAIEVNRSMGEEE